MSLLSSIFGGGGNKSASTTTTETNVDSKNHIFTNAWNTSDSNNLTIAVGPGSDAALPVSGAQLAKQALTIVAVLAALAVGLAWLVRRRKSP